MTRPLAVDIVVPGASFGGAEALLLRLLDPHAARLDARVTALGQTRFADEAAGRGWPVTVVPTGRTGPAVAAAAVRLTRRWRRDPPDVVLANGVKAAAVAVPAAFAAGVPVVWFKHDFSLDRQLARPLAAIATAVVASGPHVAEATGRAGVEVLLPPAPRPALPADEARRRLVAAGLPGDAEHVVICLGRLVDYKGVDDAVRALVTARGWHVAVIGQDDPAAPGESGRLERLARDVDVEHRVHFLGDLDEGGRLLAAADAVAVLTKLGAGNRGREGWSLVADEALAAGVPLIAARGGAVAERVGGAGIAVDPAAPEQVAAALEHLRDAETRRAMGAAGQAAMKDRPDTAAQGSRLVGVLAAAARRPGAGLEPARPVTVVVPAWNEGPHVAASLQPLIDQLGPDDELVVVHDPSPDETGAALDELAGPQIRVLHRPEGSSGISSARNAGIAAARHDRIACTDIGCVPQPGWLDALKAGLDDEPSPALVTGLYDVVADGPLQEAMSLACYPAVEEARRTGPLTRVYGALLGRVFDPSLPTGRSMAFTRQAWQDAGGFPESLATAEDVGFGQTIVAGGGRAVLATEAVVRWDQRPTVAGTATMFFRYGVGDGESRHRGLVARNLARLVAYTAGTAALAGRRRSLRALATAGAAFYLSVPMARAVRRRSGATTVALIPAALALKDLTKIAGCLVGLRRPPAQPPAAARSARTPRP